MQASCDKSNHHCTGMVNTPHSPQGHPRGEGRGVHATFWDKPLKSLLSQSHSTRGDDFLPKRAFCLLSLVAVQLCHFFLHGVFSFPALEGV